MASPTSALDALIPTLLSSAVALATVTSTDFLVPPSLGPYVGPFNGPPGGPQDPPPPPPPNGECQLLGPFALIVQGALGVLALSALVFKRWRERPQRPLKIWFFDVSKQIVGSILVHIANLVMSMLSSGQFSVKASPEIISGIQRRMAGPEPPYQPNPCSFYLLNLAIDTTLGIPILILLLRVFTGLFAMTPLGQPSESIRSGNYGQPPKAYWWFKQSIIYFLGLLGMKICVLFIFLVLPWISRIGDWALRWTDGNEELQVFFVMMFFPLIMNATQYYIIDTFIKNQKPDEHEAIPSDDDEDSFVADAARDGNVFGEDRPEADGDDSVGDDENITKSAREAVTVHAKTKSGKKGLQDRHSYDEEYDGESSPTVVGSADQAESSKLLGDESIDESNPKR